MWGAIVLGWGCLWGVKYHFIEEANRGSLKNRDRVVNRWSRGIESVLLKLTVTSSVPASLEESLISVVGPVNCTDE